MSSPAYGAKRLIRAVAYDFAADILRSDIFDSSTFTEDQNVILNEMIEEIADALEKRGKNLLEREHATHVCPIAGCLLCEG